MIFNMNSIDRPTASYVSEVIAERTQGCELTIIPSNCPASGGTISSDFDRSLGHVAASPDVDKAPILRELQTEFGVAARELRPLDFAPFDSGGSWFVIIIPEDENWGPFRALRDGWEGEPTDAVCDQAPAAND